MKKEKKNSKPEDFKIRSTVWVGNVKHISNWIEYFKKSGFEWMVKTKLIKGKPAVALYRKITAKEREEIKAGKYRIFGDSILLVPSTKRDRKRNNVVNCICPRCGVKHVGYNCDTRMFCRSCAVVAGRDVDIEGEATLKPKKKGGAR